MNFNDNTVLKPTFNGYQYLFIVIVAIVLDAIIHFFTIRKYNALKTKTDCFGFLPALGVYYNSLATKGPLSAEAPGFNATCNTWLMGALFAGIVAFITLLITDITMYIIDYQKKKKNNTLTKHY